MSAPPPDLATEFHTIGPRSPVYVIAEIGLNHDGDFAQAERMIEAAHEAGASAVKFQLFSADHFIDSQAALGDGGPGTLREFFRGFELSADDWTALARRARELGLDFFCSVFDEPSLELHQRLAARPIKIASCDVTNRPLLEAARATGLPVLLSTGTADEAEVARAVEWLRPSPLVLLQCVSSYPARPADYNLGVLAGWRERYGCPVGISDHCEGNAVSLAAVALGACVVERHFTLDRRLPGPDHALSLEPAELKSLVADAARVRAALEGDGRKRPAEAEAGARQYGRRSLYSARPFRRGTPVEPADLIPLRPGGGIGPENIAALAGKVWQRDGAAGQLITADAIADAAPS